MPKNSSTTAPLHERKKKQDEIYESLLADIQGEKVAVGSLLPSTRQLAKHFGTSLTPVNLALRRLESQSYVETIHGSGVVVRAASTTESEIRLRPLVEVVTSLSGQFQEGAVSPGLVPVHNLYAAQEWLLWSLRERPGLRMRTCVITRSWAEQQLREILNEAMVFKPAVLALPLAEDFSDETLACLREVRKGGTRPVLRTNKRDAPDFDRVYSNFRQGQCDLTSYLLEKGCRQILRVTGNTNLFYEQQKQKGFEDSLMTIGISSSQAREWTILLPDLPSKASGSERTSFWAKLLRPVLKIRPSLDAVMTVSDMDAVSAQLALAKMGRGDIEVTGYDNDWPERRDELEALYGETAFSRLKQPASVDTMLREFGVAMADLVFDCAFGQVAHDQIQVRTVRQSLVVP